MFINQNFTKLAIKTTILAMTLASCATQEVNDEVPITTTGEGSSSSLQLIADGEDFIIEGFESKDGWRIDFESVTVSINDVVAHQTEPPFDADSDQPLQATESLTLISSPTVINLMLADGNNGSTILVTETEAPLGHYNALSWKMENQPDNIETLVLSGTAQKDEQEINFTLRFPIDVSYVCGEFVGDERKGLVTENSTAEVHLTFHFDHIFGDAEKDSTHEVNVAAPGFEPMASFAQNDTLDIDLDMLQENLSPEDYQRVEESLLSLGHVGEGHCRLDP
jgi:hypothetical protein